MNIYLFQEEIESDDAILFHHVDSKYILGYNTYGYVALYEKTEDDIDRVWSKQDDFIEFLISNDGVVYIYNSDNLLLEAVDFYQGNILNTYSVGTIPGSFSVWMNE